MTTCTEKKMVLPIKNEHGTFEIRMESIGGQGANLAGKILADAAILDMCYNGISFASYGSEKKGTPVRAYIRLNDSDKEIRINSPVVEPHLLVVFATVLVKNVSIMTGVKPGAKIIVNTHLEPDVIRDMLKVPGGTTLYCLDAMKIAVEERVRINTVILGAIPRAFEFLEKQSLENGINRMFEKKYPALVGPNVKGFQRGFDETKEFKVEDDGKYPYVAFHGFEPRLGYKNAPIGGLITNPGNTVLNDLSASRSGFMPKWIEEKCINCAECYATCPDQCIEFVRRATSKGVMKQHFDHIDAKHCKGCLRCAEICPTKAIVAERETH